MNTEQRKALHQYTKTLDQAELNNGHIMPKRGGVVEFIAARNDALKHGLIFNNGQLTKAAQKHFDNSETITLTFEKGAA